VTENRRDRLAVNPPSMFMPKGYSHGVSVEGNCIVFVSGQSGRNSDGSLLSDIVAQTSQALKNVRTTIEAFGGSMNDLGKLTILVTDMREYLSRSKELAALFRASFGKTLPAMSLAEVSRFMDEEVKIEVDGYAMISEPSPGIET
jgi:enamine deaminase RidA (YjgF/YER057c/UK114 family)